MSSKGKGKEAPKEAPKEVVKKEVVKAGLAEGEANIMDDLTKKQAYKKFSYRGEDISKLLAMNMDDLA
jgi:hypothetical protein